VGGGEAHGSLRPLRSLATKSWHERTLTRRMTMGASPGRGKKEFLPLPRPAVTRMGRRAAERRARPILRPFFDATINYEVCYCSGTVFIERMVVLG